MAPVSVLLAVNDALQRALLLRALRRRDDLLVAGTEADGEQALAAILRDAPDVAVVEAGLPSLGGLELCRRLAETRTDVGTRVLLLVDHSAMPRERAVASGAAGSLPSTCTSAQLCDAVASIANGGTMFHV